MLGYPQQGILNNWPDPLLRNRGAVDAGEQQKLTRSCVTVCGCGGLGGLVIEDLARIGVGRLRIVDPDIFNASNLNRQLGALRGTLGKNKAEIMAERVRGISKCIEVEALAYEFGETDALHGIDVAIDCLDNSASRLQLAERCNTQQIPLVHGAVDGWYGQIGVQPVGGDLVHRLYCTGGKDAKAVSVLSFTATLIASLQAAETVKLLIGRPSKLTSGWLAIDLSTGDFDYIT